jgi:hypothetical protein
VYQPSATALPDLVPHHFNFSFSQFCTFSPVAEFFGASFISFEIEAASLPIPETGFVALEIKVPPVSTLRAPGFLLKDVLKSSLQTV